MKKTLIVALMMVAGIAQAACEGEQRIVDNPKGLSESSRAVWVKQLASCLEDANERAIAEAKREAEQAVLRAEEAERQRIVNERLAAERKIEEAKERVAAKKAAVVQAEETRKSNERRTKCINSMRVGMSIGELETNCGAQWTSATDYGSVRYDWYQSRFARVMVQNGVVKIISY
jgi:hypothetical protein